MLWLDFGSFRSFALFLKQSIVANGTRNEIPESYNCYVCRFMFYLHYSQLPMKIISKSVAIVTSLCIMALFASCSEDTDNPKYQSEPPLISDLTVSVNGQETSTVHVGDKFTVTAVQKQIGRLLYKSNYTWTNDSGFEVEATGTAIYDNDSKNPTATFTATSAGNCKITFTGRYYASGQVVGWTSKYGSSYYEDFADKNGRATYSFLGSNQFSVVATKTITVLL